MTTEDKVEFLIQQASELPDEAQSELFKSLIQMLAPNLGTYETDDEDR